MEHKMKWQNGTTQSKTNAGKAAMKWKDASIPLHEVTQKHQAQD